MSTNYVCPSTIDMVEVEDEWIVMNTEQFTITKLNPIGAFILKNIQANHSIDEIIEDISTNYSADKMVLQTDIQAFLEELEEIGLIKNER